MKRLASANHLEYVRAKDRAFPCEFFASSLSRTFEKLDLNQDSRERSAAVRGVLAHIFRTTVARNTGKLWPSCKSCSKPSDCPSDSPQRDRYLCDRGCTYLRNEQGYKGPNKLAQSSIRKKELQ